MRKVLPYLGASLSALAMAWSTPAVAQDPFKDLDPKHWAYEAVTDLQQKGILLGYPDGYFKGKRTLTRYEFAIALKRALDKITAQKGDTGPPGEKGPPGEAGPQGPPGMTPEEVQNLRRLTDEFRNELTSLGANIRDINNRLDQMAKDIADIKNRLDRMIQWSGSAFFGFRTDRSRFPFLDYSGAGRGASNTHFGLANALHDVHLIAQANIAGGIKANVDLAATNYVSYRGGTFSGGVAPIGPSTSAPALLGPNSGALLEDIFPYQAYVDVPIGGEKSNTLLTVGRYKHQLTPLTYWRPDLDSYFDIPTYDDGNFIQDGIRIKSRVGSLGINLWAASYATVTGTHNLSSSTGAYFNRPTFGSAAGQQLFTKPFGLDPEALNAPNSRRANQSVGIGLGVPVFHMGELGFNVFELATNFPPGGSPYDAMVVYDANFKFNPLGRIMLYAEGSKSVTQIGINQADPTSINEDNNAFLFNAGYSSGPIDVKAGYTYIDPRYSAPGYWLKIGNWWNPTNVMGPFVKIGYKVSDALQVRLGGDFLSGARNRPGFLTTDDNINRVNAGVNYRLNKMWDFNADYEGVFYDVTNRAGFNTSLTGARTKPVEQYITLGAGVNLTGNTVLKLAYQIISFDNVGGVGSTYPTGLGIGGGGTTSNASVFTTQLAVHF